MHIYNEISICVDLSYCIFLCKDILFLGKIAPPLSQVLVVFSVVIQFQGLDC